MFAENNHLPPLLEDKPEPRRRLLKIAAVCAAIGALGVGAFRYGAPKLREHDRLKASLPGLQRSLAVADDRMAVAEEKIRTWAGDREIWQDRFSKMEEQLGAGLLAARRETQQLASQVKTEMERRTQALQARLGVLESGRQADRLQLARLEQDLAAARSEISQQSQEVARLRQQTNQDLDRVDQQLAGRDAQVGHHRQNLDVLAVKTDRTRLDFEISKNRSREVAPGVSLGITKTNTAHRRVDGWIWLMPDRRTVWIRGQNVQQPVVFYSREDPRPRELVITHVTSDSAVGYVLLPARPLPGGSLSRQEGAGGPPAQ
jgi:predicted  nucleic acid-binding Zn-ribbon protein